jgi:4-amino-4-deoxy-L-arabinose transferase-like glycosyltransferase
MLTNNPYWIQIFLGIALLCLTYYLGIKLFDKRLIAVLASLLLIFDPSFFEVSTQALLDLGQAVFALTYLIMVLYYPKKYKLQGLFLGLFIASKFWTAALFFVLIVYGYKYLLKEKLEVIKILYTFSIAAVVFIAFYLKAYIMYGRYFDIMFFEAKVVKYMLQHNSSEVFGGSIFLFITGYYESWWGSGITRSSVWTILWPITFITNLIMSIRRKLSYDHLIFVLPVLYLLLLSKQVPFTRYFIIVLPFFYLGLSKALIDIGLSLKKGR